MRSIRFSGAVAMALVTAAAVFSHQPPAGGQAARTTAWFGVTPSPGFRPDVPPVILGTDYGPRPATIPAGEEAHRSLEGQAIRRDLETIVGFSKWSRETKEVGTGQLWGRITGLPSGERTMDWVERRFREAGVPRIERQRFDQTPKTSLWLPLSWEVRLHADAAFGAGSRDVILESAMPAGGTVLPPEGLAAPLVFVAASTYGAGDNPDVDGPVLQLIQGNPLYHTTGDMLETISTPGLERVARFVEYFVRQVAAAPRSRFYPESH